jgi:hypothetical protein
MFFADSLIKFSLRRKTKKNGIGEMTTRIDERIDQKERERRTITMNEDRE